MRKIGKTIDTIKSVEIVKYSSTFVLLWVCVNKELFQIEENEKAKSLLERIIFQSGIKDHSNICNIFGCLKSVRKDDEIDEVTSELFAKLKIDDQVKVDSKPDTVDICTKSVVSSEEIGEEDVTSRELEELQKKLREEKSKIFKQLCILQDSVTQTTDQSQDRFHQTIKFTDEKPISKVFDVIQTNVSYLNENLLRLQDEIRSKEKTVKTQGEQINELQQQSFQSEIEKRKISEKLEIVCKEKEDLRKLRVLGNNISLEEERITEQEKTYNKNIIDLQQKTQQLEAEKDILLEKYKGVCKERDGFKDGSIFKDEIRAKEEVITKHDDTMEELEKRLQQLGTEKDSMLASYEKVCKEKDELINR
ncbi:unnamed protein product [Mytilus edulis]|uniref:Uncharacterized protein n=1 Tax=Mytilus edulis TaxID=6550 RepID=A0A8S3Q1N2_MYTED|nr:unnamed protein product [Mytilus edulis]